jgi:predicted dienelactone hydrolase
MRIAVALMLLAAAAPAGARCTLADLLARGPYGVGHRQLALVDTTRGTDAWGGHAAEPSRTLPTDVWYPIADASGPGPVEGAPAATGRRFPFVVNSPGLGDVGSGEAYLGIALASRGYVVASPTFPRTSTTFLIDPAGPELQDVKNQPGDVTFVMDQLIGLSRAAGSWLAGAIDEKRIGVSGLSLGGLNTLLVTYHPTLRDRRIKAAAAMAPASCYLGETFYDSARPPLLLLGGDEDLITPLPMNAARTFAFARRSPRRLVTLAHATHTAFSGLVTNPSTTSYDTTLGCRFLEGKVTQQQVDATIAGFGNPSYIDGTGCELPCTTPPPSTPPMQAARQHDLAQGAIVAFFDTTFRKPDRDAACFLARGLAKEPDATVEKKKARRVAR